MSECITRQTILSGAHRSVIFGLLCCFMLLAPQAGAGDLPEVKVTNVRQVFDNGEHNAFTDLVRWQDAYWLTFRSCPDGHMVHPTSSIIVLTSADTRDWKQVHRFSVPKRDTRDPHFLVFKDQLFVYTGTWYSGDTTLPRDEYDLNKHLGYAAWTGDGVTWKGPRQLEGTYGHYIWRAAAHDGTAYLCGRRNKGHAQVWANANSSSRPCLKATTVWSGVFARSSRRRTGTRQRLPFRRTGPSRLSAGAVPPMLNSLRRSRRTRNGRGESSRSISAVPC